MTKFFPATQEAVAQWLLGLTVGYIVVRIIAVKIRKGAFNNDIGVYSDALMFSGSAILIMGVISHTVLVALGDLTTYLIFAGVVGLGVTVYPVFVERKRDVLAPQLPISASGVLPEAKVAEIVQTILDRGMNAPP